MALLASGDLIGGRYRIEGEIGRGGMAIVYKARHERTGQAHAIKLILPQFASRRDIVDRFLHEARVGARLGRHPNIVDVSDADVDPTLNTPYLVMELLEGETLQQRLARGPIAPAEAVVLLDQLRDGLALAHEAGVVHRDLKPGNLFLARERRGKSALKIVDFGIAKVLQEDEDQGTATTIGTAFYAAPEQLGPAIRKLALRQRIEIASTVSPATDVWALALIAYEVLTGLGPGHYWDARTAADLPLQMSLALTEPSPPTERAGSEAHRLPEGFDGWFLRCTRFDARQRPAGADEALAPLLDLLGGLPSAPLPNLPQPPPARAEVPSQPHLAAATQLPVETFVASKPEAHAVAAISPPPQAPPGSETSFAGDLLTFTPEEKVNKPRAGKKGAKPPAHQEDPAEVRKRDAPARDSNRGAAASPRVAGYTSSVLRSAALTVVGLGGLIGIVAMVYQASHHDPAGSGEQAAASVAASASAQAPAAGVQKLAANDPALANAGVAAQITPPAGMAHIKGAIKFGLGTRNEPVLRLIGGKPVANLIAVSPFFLDLTEVSVNDFKRCVNAQACSLVTTAKLPGKAPTEEQAHTKLCNASDPSRGDHPINCVDWSQAKAYCEWVGKRLPSEAEWEFAARGGGSQAFPWDDHPPAAGLVNACDASCKQRMIALGLSYWQSLYKTEVNDEYPTTAPVDSFPGGKSPDGVMHLAGNVVEWVNGSLCPYGEYNCSAKSSDTVDGKPFEYDPAKKVVRGGSWGMNDEYYLKNTTRAGYLPETRNAFVGFRCAQDAKKLAHHDPPPAAVRAALLAGLASLPEQGGRVPGRSFSLGQPDRLRR